MFEYFDATLSPSIQASSQEHLRHCQACRQAFDQEQRFSGSLSGLLKHQTRSLQISADLQEKVLARVRQRPQAAVTRLPLIHIRPALRWALAAAACLLIASITAFLTWHQPPGAGVVSLALRSPPQLPLASLPVQQDIRASTQRPINVKWDNRQAQLAAAQETALAEVKAHQEAVFSSIAARQQRYFQELAQRTLQPIHSAVALETAMKKITADQESRFSSLEPPSQRSSQPTTQRAARPARPAVVPEAVLAAIKARQVERFSRIEATQRRLIEKIHAPRKPAESSWLADKRSA